MRANFIMICLLFFTGCSLISLILPGSDNADTDLKGLAFINEVSASHPSDADWIEIYNASDQSVDLWGFGLTDDPILPFKWIFPLHSIIAAKSFMVVDMDGQKGNPDFGIAAGTDQVIITTPDGKTVIDAEGPIPVTGSSSYGRSEDGGNTWVVFPNPTKGGPNQ